MGAYGRLLRYVAAIKQEVALKVLIGLAISTTYIGQALVMAKAVSVVFVGGSVSDIARYLVIALVAVFLGGKLPIPEAYLVPSSAFVFALLTCLLIYFIGRARAITAETMVLAGIGLMFLFHALLALLQYMASAEALQAIVFWLFGSLMKATWPKVGLVSAVLVLAIPMIVKDAWKLTALKLGDEKAKSLGINVERLRLKTFVLISLLTASAVCFVGTIGFIGLVGPHIARMLVGEDQRFFLPLSALGGALLLSLASIGSKLIILGAIFPIGIVTSLIGVPFFFSLILTQKREYW